MQDRRHREAGLLLGAGVAVLVAALVFGAAMVWPREVPRPAGEPQAAASVTLTPEPAADPVQAAGAAPTTGAPSATRTHRPPVQASKRPIKIAGPPPPPPPPSPPPGGCPWYTGPTAPRSQVKAALDAAAARRYWNSRPQIKVPVKLVYAVAWQESGWQSTIMACDGGIGTMQVMPNTATWMNQRFGTPFDVHTLSGNTLLGGQYLAWLVAYFGEVYFDSQYEFYDESTGEVVNEVLLNSVISAYNVGYGAVDPTKAASGIPNPGYVNNVRALMQSCPCTAG